MHHGEGEPQTRLAAWRNPGITKQASEQQNEIRNQSSELTCLGPTTQRNEDNDSQEPQGQQACDQDGQAAEHTGMLSRS